MNRARIVLLSIAAALVFAGMAYSLIHQSEPEYQGKPVSAWIKELQPMVLNDTGPAAQARAAKHQKAVEAIRKLGTNAIPFLIAELQACDSPLKLKVASLAAKQSFFTIKFRPAQIRHRVACEMLFEQVGLLRPWVPALTQLLWQKDFSSHAAQLLAQVPDGAGLDALANAALQTINRVAQECAMVHLGGLAFEVEPVVPALVQGLTNADDRTRYFAAEALGNIRKNANLLLAGKLGPELSQEELNVTNKILPHFDATMACALPLLTANLAHPDPSIREAAVTALGAFGSTAKNAIPLLIKGINDPDGNVRAAATNALRRIDSGVAEKAGVLPVPMPVKE